MTETKSQTARATFPIVVHVLMEQNGDWFLLRRANTGYLDGCWTLPGGHVKAGEEVRDAALRECREETGVVIAPGDLSFAAVMPYQSDGHQGVDFIARASGWEGDPYLAESKWFDECTWAAADRLPVPLAPYIPDLREMLTAGEWFRELGD